MKLIPNFKKPYIGSITFKDFEDTYPWGMAVEFMRYYPEKRKWVERSYRVKSFKYSRKFEYLLNKHRKGKYSGIVNLNLPPSYISLWFFSPWDRFKYKLAYGYLNSWYIILLLYWLFYFWRNK